MSASLPARSECSDDVTEARRRQDAGDGEPDPRHGDGEPDPRHGATITPYRDGPLVVRGIFRLVDQDGNEIDPGRETIALCRCGKSGIKPFCDGSHKRAGFAAPSAPSRPRPAAQILRAARRNEAAQR